VGSAKKWDAGDALILVAMTDLSEIMVTALPKSSYGRCRRAWPLRLRASPVSKIEEPPRKRGGEANAKLVGPDQTGGEFTTGWPVPPTGQGQREPSARH
jgi:hypothetical protein